MTFSFGDFTLNTDRLQLLRFDEEVHLEPKAMQLLQILVECRPNVVLQQELFDQIWPDVLVLEANLGNLVSDLRNALGDHDRKLIRTVRGRGYAFSGEVVLGEDRPSRTETLLVLLHGKRRVVPDFGENVIGRGGEANIVIEDTAISRHHARVVVNDAGTTIEDLESKNGTFVNGVRITSRTKLNDGDELRLGPIALKVKVVMSEASTETAPFD